MTPTAIAILGFAAWTLTLLLVLGLVRTAFTMRGKTANSFKPSGEDLPGFPYRLTRAHANCYENLPTAAAVMLYAIATDQTAMTDPLAFVFLGARLAQSTAHILSTANPMVLVRFLLFLVQQVILVLWLARFFGILPA